jgi:zinc protease
LDYRAMETVPGHSPNTREKRDYRPRLDVERAQLPNGLILILSENRSTPSVAIKAVVRAGSRFEPDDKAGLAAVTGDLLDEGTSTRSAEQIAITTEQVGGRLSTFGEYQSSGAQAAFLAKDVSVGLEITADLLINATFPDEKVTQIIDRRVAQIKSRLDVPRIQASDLLNEIVFEGHPEHRPPVGYQSTVMKLARSDILGFYHKYYIPNNTALAIVGDIDKVAIMKEVDARFGKWRPVEDFEAPCIPPPAEPGRATEKYVNANKEQVNVYLGKVGIERKNPDYHSLLVLDTILGSSPGFTSRIPRILRDEQGLAYSTFSNITSSARIDPGRFVAYIGTSPQNLARAIEGLRREIVRIVSEPVSAEELEGAQAYLTGSFVFEFQTNAQIARFLLDAEDYALGYDYPDRYPDMINSVTVSEVLRVARKYLDPDHLATVVVGPVDQTGRVVTRNS